MSIPSLRPCMCASAALLEWMDDPNMTMEEYIKFEEEKARRHSRVFDWKTATYGKIKVDDDLYDLRSMEAEFPALNLKMHFSANLNCFDDLDFFEDFENEFPAIVYNEA
ncbi:hypothetical protein Tco_0868813 [Tanacetum coccineum]